MASFTASVGTATTTDGDKTPRSRTASVGEATVEAGVRVKKIPEAVEATYVYRSGKNLVVTRRS